MEETGQTKAVCSGPGGRWEGWEQGLQVALEHLLALQRSHIGMRAEIIHRHLCRHASLTHGTCAGMRQCLGVFAAEGRGWGSRAGHPTAWARVQRVS